MQLVLEENVWRFLGKMTYESHENPVYYNVITILAGYMPYTLLVVISLFVWKHRETFFRKRSWWSCLRENLFKMNDVRLFSILNIVLVFFFYCIPKSKRSVYLLPIYPFIAYFLAEYILYLRHVRPIALKIFGNIIVSFSLLLLVVFIFFALGVDP